MGWLQRFELWLNGKNKIKSLILNWALSLIESKMSFEAWKVSSKSCLILESVGNNIDSDDERGLISGTVEQNPLLHLFICLSLFFCLNTPVNDRWLHSSCVVHNWCCWFSELDWHSLSVFCLCGASPTSAEALMLVTKTRADWVTLSKVQIFNSKKFKTFPLFESGTVGHVLNECQKSW